MSTEIKELTADMSQRSLWWVNPSYKLPEDKEGEVLMIVSGKHGNITFDHAIVLGNYYTDEGWYISGYPEMRPETITVYAWAKIRVPRELEASNAR